MFEKMREYSLYIIVCVASLALIGILTFNVLTGNQGNKISGDITSKIMSNYGNDGKSNLTAFDLIENSLQKWKINGYNLNKDEIVILNSESLKNVFVSQMIIGDYKKLFSTTTGTISLVLFPEIGSFINHNGGMVIDKNMIILYDGTTVIVDDYDKIPNNIKGLTGVGGFGFGVFDEESAEKFRDDFFNGIGAVVEDSGGSFYVVVQTAFDVEKEENKTIKFHSPKNVKIEL